MAIKEYTYNDKTQLSQHFNVQEFKCKCGKNHSIKIATDLVTLLENLRSKLNATSCNIYSGYRCPTHDKKIGGSGRGPHTQGYAVDCYFIGQDGKRISSQKVCLTLEDMGHKKGIGYRCGGSASSTGQTHIDVKPRKWYGDESKSMTASIGSSFYTYFGIRKPSTYKGIFPKLPSKGYIGRGDKGEQVLNLQKFLNWANECKLSLDKSCGPATETQIKIFQKDNDLVSDGKFGPESLNVAKTIKK